MKRLFLICVLPVAALTIFSGCSIQPKKNPFIAIETEETFKQRWITKRASDLLAAKQAANADEARRVATEEFEKKFPAASVVRQPGLVGDAGETGAAGGSASGTGGTGGAGGASGASAASGTAAP